MTKPGGTGIIGPFPPHVGAGEHDADDARDEYDKLRRRVLWKMPSGLYVLGAVAGERRNGMTVNWVSQVSFEPKLVAVSVEQTAFTHELLLEGGVFSVNLISVDDRAVVRKFTKPVEVDLAARTLNGFGFHDGITGAPLLDLRGGVDRLRDPPAGGARRSHPVRGGGRRRRLPGRRGDPRALHG